MSSTVLARFHRYGKLFGGRQGASSLHFLGLIAFGTFTAVHTFMVVIHGVPNYREDQLYCANAADI